MDRHRTRCLCPKILLLQVLKVTEQKNAPFFNQLLTFHPFLCSPCSVDGFSSTYLLQIATNKGSKWLVLFVWPILVEFLDVCFAVVVRVNLSDGLEDLGEFVAVSIFPIDCGTWVACCWIMRRERACRVQLRKNDEWGMTERTYFLRKYDWFKCIRFLSFSLFKSKRTKLRKRDDFCESSILPSFIFFT